MSGSITVSADVLGGFDSEYPPEELAFGGMFWTLSTPVPVRQSGALLFIYHSPSSTVPLRVFAEE